MQPSRGLCVPWSTCHSVQASNKDNESWPKLGVNAQTKCLELVPSSVGISQNKVDNYIGANLDCVQYPKLGEKLISSRNDGASSRPLSVINMYDEDSIKYTRIRTIAKRYKRPEKIYINLEEALENSMFRKKLHGKHLACSSSDCGMPSMCLKSYFNGDKNKVVSKVKICNVQPNRFSHIKKIIILSREMKVKENLKKREIFEKEKMEAISRDVNDINFESLKITSDPKIDINYRQRMSSLNFYGKDYRRTIPDNIPEDIVSLRPDLISKLNNLDIRNPEEDGKCYQQSVNIHLQQDTTDMIVIDQTFSLKLNDDNKDGIIKNETKTENSSNELTYSRNFREYCTNMLTKPLNECLEKFLIEIARLQKKLYVRDSNKGRYRRRYYCGLKEVQKHVEMKKVQFVVIAPDLEKVELEGGLDEHVYKLLESCKRYAVMFCFGLRRRKLGYFMHGKGFVGCVGIGNYGGLEDLFKNVLLELVPAINEFRKLKGEPEELIDISDLIPENDVPSNSIKLLKQLLTSAT